ncbi:MAG: hypothetical protein K9L30_07600 [Desulfobacterales bacterium]|nr:hypothetical protein [Desulfobacterales bacterium]
MKKLKVGFWIIIFVLLVLIGYQNIEFFSTQQAISLDIIKHFETKALFIGYWLLICFAAGLIVAYLLNMTSRLKLKKKIKILQAQYDSVLAVAQPTAQDDTASGSEVAEEAASQDVIEMAPSSDADTTETPKEDPEKIE